MACRQTPFIKTNHLVIIGFIALTFIFDFLNKIEIFYELDFPPFNRYLKGVIVLYSIGFIVMNYRYVYKNLSCLLVTIATLSLIFAIKPSYWNLYLPEFYRYIFILFSFPVLHYSFNYVDREKFLRIFYNLFKVMISVNLVAVVAGLVFGILAFKTYEFQRLGYNGFLLSQGLTPYVYLAATALFWTKRDYLFLTMVFLASLLSGIKGVYFGQFLLVIFLAIFNDRYSNRQKIKTILISGFIMGLILMALFIIPPFSDVIRDKGLISAVFSFRIENLFEILNMSDEGQFNFLIGATGIETVRVELQLFDVYLFFGLLGVIAYSFFMVNVFKKTVTTTDGKAFFFSSLFLSFLSGNLLYIPLSTTLFFAVGFYINYQKHASGKHTMD